MVEVPFVLIPMSVFPHQQPSIHLGSYEWRLILLVSGGASLILVASGLAPFVLGAISCLPAWWWMGVNSRQI